MEMSKSEEIRAILKRHLPAHRVSSSLVYDLKGCLDNSNRSYGFDEFLGDNCSSTAIKERKSD